MREKGIEFINSFSRIGNEKTFPINIVIGNTSTSSAIPSVLEVVPAKEAMGKVLAYQKQEPNIKSK